MVMQSVRDTIGDPDGAATERWTDAEIARYCDRAGLMVVLDTGFVLRTAWTFSLANTTQEYVMAENFIEAHRVKWIKGGDDTDQRELEYLTFERFMDLNSTDPTTAGDPKYYTYWNKLFTDSTTSMQPPIMMLYPVKATGGDDSDTVRVWGVKTPDIFVSTGTYGNMVEMRGQHVEALILYAASLAQWDDGEAGMAQMLEGRYQRTVEKIKHDEARRDRSSRPSIRPRSSRLNGYYQPALPQHFNRRWGV
jgi:hypothetical protein